MRLVADPTITLGWLVSKVRPPALSGTFFIKGTYRLKPGGPAVPHEEPRPPGGDAHKEDNPEKPLRYESDFVPFKPRADIVVVGTCHAPAGKKATVLRPGFRVGSRARSVAVIGKRLWKRGPLGVAGQTEPEPFTKIPITYDLAYGGPDFKRNPTGAGHRSVELPLIENPDRLLRSPGDGIDPAGFGPIPRMWEQRLRLTGTYGAKWKKERWPWFPEDFDFLHFNCAPPEQQVEGYLKGDEELAFDLMHPAHGKYASRLPGLRARCFLEDRAGGKPRWREVPLKLDTLWIDMDAEIAVLLWRGMVDVQSLKLREIDHLFAFMEKLADPPANADQARALFEKRRKPAEEDAKAKEEEAAKDAAEDAAFEKEMAAMEKETAADKAEGVKLEEQAMKSAREGGIDPAKLAPGAAPGGAKEAQAAFAKFAQELKAGPPQIAAKGAAVPAVAFETEEKEEPEEPEEDADRNWTREEVAAAAAKGHAFADHDLSGLDLSGLDLSGANFARCALAKANLAGAKLVKADFTQADVSKANLAEADLSGANLDRADFTGSKLPKAKLVGASLKNVELAKCVLEGADFSEATGKGAYFTGSALGGAKFKGAKLQVADFEKADLAGADFTGAELKAAGVEEVKGAGAIFDGADLSGLRGGAAPDFTGASFKNVSAEGSVWSGGKFDKADFTGAKLARADFELISGKGAIFTRADLTSALFADAGLQGARFRDANLLRANFERADLTQADLSGVNAFEAEFWDAKIEKTVLEGAKLKGTKLA